MAHPYWSMGRLPRQKSYFKTRIKISEMLQGPIRLENESHEEYAVRRNSENALLKDYLSGVWMVDDRSTALDK